MGTGQSRSAGRQDRDDSRRLLRPQEVGRARSRATRPVAWLLALIALLGPGTSALPRARAQDEPPKVEAPKPAPPAAPDQPKDSTPPPPDLQPKDSDATEKQKAPPSALDDPQKATASAPDPAAIDRALDRALALSSRYKFSERYGLNDDPARPELITQYRVGVREKTKWVNDKAQAAPDRFERNRLFIYSERAAQVGRNGEPNALVRRYDFVQFKDGTPMRRLNPPFLEGLTVWYHRRPPMRPQVLSLTPDRSLRDAEFGYISEEVSIPMLASFLPPAAVRASETWTIRRDAILQILGEMPDPEEFEMTGTLLKVSKLKDGKTCVADVGVSGQFNALVAGLSSFSARIEFTFEPRGLALPAPDVGAAPKAEGGGSSSGARGRDGVVEATGRITYAFLSHAAARPTPGTDGRLKTTITSELVLERRTLTPSPGERAAPNAPLPLPEAPPIATEANSWLTYVDPEGRFQFRHPQEFRAPPNSTDPYKIHLFDIRQSGDAALFVSLPSKDTAAPHQSRNSSTPST